MRELKNDVLRDLLSRWIESKEAAEADNKPLIKHPGQNNSIRLRILLPALAVLVSAGMSVSDTQANEPADPSGTRPGERLPPFPTYREPEKKPMLELPPVAPPSEHVPYALRLFVKSYRIVGNTVIATDELKQIAAPFENRHVTSADLEELRQRLTRHYINKGYINSGAILPDQKAVDGVVELRIIEGTLARIDVEGAEHFRAEYFKDRLARRAGPPLNVKELEQELQLFLQDPLIESVNARLLPGDRPGVAVLGVRVKEAPRTDFGILVDNKMSPSLGEARLVLQGEYRNLAGRGDILSAELGVAQGIKGDLSLSYSLPMSARGETIELTYQRAESLVVQEPFAALDIVSKGETIGFGSRQPVFVTPTRKLYFTGMFQQRNATTYLLGVPYSFSPGVQNGESTISVLRLGQEFVNRTRDNVLSLRSTFSLGLNLPGVTIHPTDPDARFISWLGQLQWARRLNNRGHQLLLRYEHQLTPSELLPIEQFSIGGLDSVRGYRTNQAVNDTGYSASLEYRMPVFRNPIDKRNLQFAAFADAGGGRNNSAATPNISSLASVGAGLLWDPDPRWHAELYYAKALNSVVTEGSSIQDSGIFFRVNYHPYRKR